VTDKTLDDLEFIAVQAPEAQTIHVMKALEHKGWIQGSPGRTACGRALDEMYIIHQLIAEDKPCKLCERTLPVISIMFETVAAFTNVIELADQQNEQLAYMQWLSHGAHLGYISTPFCGLHHPLLLTQDELAEDEPHVYIVRLYGVGDDFFDGLE